MIGSIYSTDAEFGLRRRKIEGSYGLLEVLPFPRDKCQFSKYSTAKFLIKWADFSYFSGWKHYLSSVLLLKRAMIKQSSNDENTRVEKLLTVAVLIYFTATEVYTNYRKFPK